MCEIRFRNGMTNGHQVNKYSLPILFLFFHPTFIKYNFSQPENGTFACAMTKYINLKVAFFLNQNI
jgi:hypothetical protein